MKKIILVLLSILFSVQVYSQENTHEKPALKYFNMKDKGVILIENLNSCYPNVSYKVLKIGGYDTKYPVVCQVKIKKRGIVPSVLRDVAKLVTFSKDYNHYIILYEPVDIVAVKKSKYYNGAIIYLPKKNTSDKVKKRHQKEATAYYGKRYDFEKKLVIKPEANQKQYKAVENLIRSNKIVQQANGLVADKYFKEAIPLYQKALRYDESHPIALYNLSYCYLKLDDLKNAIIYCTKAVEADPYRQKWKRLLKELNSRIKPSEQNK